LCHALFASSLQRSDAPGADVVAQAISATVQQLGARGCAGRMAQEFGDHPEAAVERLRWVRSLLSVHQGLLSGPGAPSAGVPIHHRASGAGWPPIRAAPGQPGPGR
jgi:hypothetical protein